MRNSKAHIIRKETAGKKSVLKQAENNEFNSGLEKHKPCTLPSISAIKHGQPLSLTLGVSV